MALGGEAWAERLTAVRRPWNRPWSVRRAAIWWAAGAAIVFGVGLVAGHGDNPLIDLKVYRVGGLTWLHGLPLYSSHFPAPLHGPDLPFTYPPFAAVAFSGFGLIGYYLAAALLVVIGFSALTWTIYLVVKGRSASGAPAVSPKYAVVLTLAAFALEPISSTFLHGQINLLLMGLVATDALGPRTRVPRGVLAGIAAAIKLTPAVFLLYFVARRQWRAAATMAASFGAATLLGFLVASSDSRTYWTSTVFDPTRIGDLSYAGNQSIRGALHRLGMHARTEELLWLLLSMAVVALAYVGARRFLARSDAAGALAVVAACQLLISPVSWSHHWVWIAPMALPLAVRVFRGGTRLGQAGMAALLVVFVVGPQWLFPNDHGLELHWAWWENLIGDTYGLVTLGFVVWSVVAGTRLGARLGSRLAGPVTARLTEGLRSGRSRPGPSAT